MYYIKVEELKIGQTFDQPVYVDDENILLPAGMPLRERDLAQLHKWKVEKVSTTGELSLLTDVNIELNEKGGMIGDDLNAEEDRWGTAQDRELYSYYRDVINKVDHLFNRIQEKQRVGGSEIEDIVSDFIPRVEEKKLEIIKLILSDKSISKSIAKSAVSCMLLVILIGLALNKPRHKLFQYGVGALIHDVGMLQIPSHIVEKRGGLTSQEFKVLKVHPIYAYKIANKELQLSEETAQLILQHHERWDGEGYPHGKKGTDITFGARLLSVVNAFEAMASPRPWRKSMSGYEAMKGLLSDNSRRFDPEVIKVFIRTVGLYPLGTLVLLSDGTIGRICGINQAAPLRPAISILIDNVGTEYKGDTGPKINLLKKKNLFITRSVDISTLMNINTGKKT